MEFLSPELNRRYAAAQGCKVDSDGYIITDPTARFLGQHYAALRLWDRRDSAECSESSPGARFYQFDLSAAEMRQLGLEWHLSKSVNTYYVTLLEQSGKIILAVHYMPIIGRGK